MPEHPLCIPAWKPGSTRPSCRPSSFEHYAERLNCVEINYTFRRLPSASTLQNWVGATPAGFVFAVKANMRITHLLRLRNAGEATALFLKMIDPLRSARRLGPILFQLPPLLKCDVALLRDYLALLPPDLRYAFEFRHRRGWRSRFTRSCGGTTCRCAWRRASGWRCRK